MSYSTWRCEYSKTKIDVYENRHHLGSYELLPEDFCRKCASPVNTNECANHADLFGFNRIYSLGLYTKGPPWGHLLSDHIRDLKRQDYYSKPLSQALSLVIKNRYSELLSADFLIPVPMHDSKLDERSFNQAEILSRRLSQLIGITMIDCLIQIKPTELRLLGREERFNILKDAIDLDTKYRSGIEDKRIILVDDVVTTGATASYCSRILINNGASHVDVLILGRTYSQ